MNKYSSIEVSQFITDNWKRFPRFLVYAGRVEFGKGEDNYQLLSQPEGFYVLCHQVNGQYVESEVSLDSLSAAIY